MQPLRIQFAAVDAPETQADRAIEWMLIALLAFCPLVFGAVAAWSEGLFLLLVCAISICFAIKLVQRRDARFVWSWTYVPIGLFLILVTFQLVLLPAGMVRTISPNTAALKMRLFAGLPDGDHATRWMTLTFYADATLRQLRLVAALAMLFVVIVNVFQRVESIRRLLIAITIIGLAEALLALAQDVTRSDGIYWMIPVYDGRALSGSFVNHSHFGQFINLSIGASISLMLLERHVRTKQEDSHHEMRALGPGVTGDEAPSSVVQSLPLYLATATIFAGSIALLLSMTRGGMLSMLAAGGLTLLILFVKAPWRKSVAASIALLIPMILIVVAWIGFDRVYHRFTSITEANAANSRGQMLSDLREAWKQFPVFGTGLGTHPVIFPMFDRSNVLAVATHAENEYAQTMTETGGVGLALAMAFVVMIWIHFAKTIRGRFSSLSAIAIGLGYGFVAILVHSLSDFGQHIPADAALTAVTCGLIVSLARQRRQRAASARAPEGFHSSIPLRMVATGILGITCAIGLLMALRAAAAEHEWRIAQSLENDLRRRNWQADNNEFARLIIHAQNAASHSPGNIDYAYWLPFYRWKWISLQPDVMSNPRYQEFARRIADELNRVRLTCPTFGLPASTAGQIERFVLHDPRGADDIRLGSELNRNDATACFVDGELAASEGDWDRSLARMKHYAEIFPNGAFEVVDLYVNEFNRPDLALAATSGDPRAPEHLAELLSQTSGDEQIITSALHRAGDLRMQAADQADAGAGDQIVAARIAIDRYDHDAAIHYLRRAIACDYSQWEVHYDLATQLDAIGQHAEAIKELHTVLRQHSQFPEAQKMLKRLEP